MAVYIFFVEKNGIDYRAQAAVQQYSFNPTADTHVRSDNPNANFGANVALEVDGSPLKVVYLKFDLSSLLGKTLQAAKLRFYVVDSTSGQIAIKQVENTSWDELSMTYTTRATPGSLITTFNGGTSGSWVEVDVTAGVNGRLGQIVSFALDETNSNGLDFSSREATINKPLLILDIEDTVNPTATSVPLPTDVPTATPTGVVVADSVIAAAGDMVADLAKTPSSKHKEVSDLIFQMNPTAVFALGDVQYESGEYSNFIKYYDPTWGRFVDKTYPAVGNHEYLTSGAAGYYDYYTQKFGGEGNTSRRPGARNQGYYSFDLGSWHIISLNTQCSKAGGCGVGSPQEKWLRADLAAYPNQCVLAFWHIPLYSSGGRANQNSKAFVQALYDYNADLILTGHDHTYERFAPQDANAKRDDLRGIINFVVGTGGKNFTSFPTTAPNSLVRNNNTMGVLRVTLRQASYDFQFVRANYSGNGTFTDSGTVQCH